MIKTFEQYSELDPYGEEEWDNNPVNYGPIGKVHEIITELGHNPAEIESDDFGRRMDDVDFSTNFYFSFNVGNRTYVVENKCYGDQWPEIISNNVSIVDPKFSSVKGMIWVELDNNNITAENVESALKILKLKSSTRESEIKNSKK